MTKHPDGLLLIDGAMRPASGGATYAAIGPWTGKEIGRAAAGSAADMDSAIAAARRAFDETNWSSDHARRTKVLTRYAKVLRANRERFAQIARDEVGATEATLAGSQVDMPLGVLDGYVAMIENYQWKRELGINPGNGAKSGFGAASRRWVFREAVGVVGAITPWNAPLQVNLAKVFPALAAGCTVILKPAPESALLSSLLGELAVEADLPPGVLNIVTGEASAGLGEALVRDPRVDLISFTGSTAVGKAIMADCAQTIKRVFLELGGKSAMILLDDANLDEALMGAAIGTMYQAGQGCATLTRVLVPRAKHDQVVATLKGMLESAEYGDRTASDQYMGPLISERQRKRVLGYIETGKAEGATLVTGGKAPEGLDGFFVQPTLFANATNDMTIAREEIFGPVLTVIPHDGEDDAVRIANDSVYGLSGGVYSASQDRAMAVAARVRAGTVSVNGGTYFGVDAPFGGYKQSGIGREMGIEGFEEYLEIKTVAAPA